MCCILNIIWRIALCLLAFSSIGTAAMIHVPADQPNIQAGVDAALDGDTVLVAPGTYSGSGNEAIILSGKNIVLTSESGASSTVLLTTGSTRTLSFAGGVDSSTIIEGFTFTGGYDSMFAWSGSYRGGILINAAGPTIRNCTVTGCFADNGGGLDITSSSSPHFVNCIIHQNFANRLGGGVRSYSDGVEFRDCRITGNRAASWAGGGLVLAGQIKLANCYIGQNRVGGVSTLTLPEYGGGICGLYQTDLTLDSCKLVQNSAYRGGAVAVIEGSLAMDHCLVYNNVARESYAGVLIDVYGPADVEGLSVSHSTFSCNYAALPGADGVAVRGFGQAHASMELDGLPSTNVKMESDVGTFDVSNSILAFGSFAAIGQFGEFIQVSCSHNDIWKVVGGPLYGGSLTDQTGINGNIYADPLFCSVSDSGFTLDQLSPSSGTGDGGTNRGAYSTGCNYYSEGAPSMTTIFAPDDEIAVDDTVRAAISRARPWDTLFIPFTAYGLDDGLLITKPFYLIGRGPDSSGLSLFASHFPKCLDIRTFCVVESLFVEGAVIGFQEWGTGVQCLGSSPILFYCAISGAGLNNTASGVATWIENGSPLVRFCDLLQNWNGWLMYTIGAFDIIAPMNYWDGATDAYWIAGLIADGRYSSRATLGRVTYEPFLLELPMSVEDETDELLPAEPLLNQNYPNPFNPSTTINFEIPRRADVTLTVYNLLGQKVQTLVDATLPAGSHTITWDATKFSSGLYVYVLESDGIKLAKKMVLLK